MQTRTISFLLGLALATAEAQINVVTYQYGNSRTGLNAAEVQLTPANVSPSTFGKLFSDAVDGYVYGQPLYVSGLSIPGKGVHNVVFVVTEHDSVYAFDADNAGAPLWMRSFIDPANGVTTVPYSDTGCSQIIPEMGITSTPVIDLASNTLYTVAMTKEGSNYVQRLHALDLTTGAERSGSPVAIQATVPGTGDGGSTVSFIPLNYKQRPALLLLNGIVYIGFSSHCDLHTYHGWLFGYDASSLQQVTVFNDTPDGIEGSFWNSGAGPSADAQGNIFIVAANGSFNGDSGGRNLGETVLKLSTNGGLSAADWFAPFDYPYLNDNDLDLGSSGALLLPDEVGSATHPHLLVTAGKNAKIYLLDRDNLGRIGSGSDSQIVQSLSAIGKLFGIPAYFNGTLYFGGVDDTLKAFPISQAQLAPAPSSQSAAAFSFPGTVPSISANGTTNGIVWALEAGSGGTLHAFDASNLASELFNTNMNPHDSLGGYVKFTAPLIANGKVYAGTQTNITVYGLLDPSPRIVSAAGPAGTSPGSLISIYGSSLATGTATASSFPLPSTLGGASVTINGTAAPLLYASPGQINAQVPFETELGTDSVVVTSGSTTLPATAIPVQSASPALFTTDGTRAAAQNQDGSLNTAANPAAPGSVLAIYGTGLGAVNPAVPTANAAPQNPPAQTTQAPTVTIGGQTAQVIFAGLSPGSVGLYQMNLQVPQLNPGDYPLVLSVAGAVSNTVTVSVGSP